MTAADARRNLLITAGCLTVLIVAVGLTLGVLPMLIAALTAAFGYFAAVAHSYTQEEP